MKLKIEIHIPTIKCKTANSTLFLVFLAQYTVGLRTYVKYTVFFNRHAIHATRSGP